MLLLLRFIKQNTRKKATESQKKKLKPNFKQQKSFEPLLKMNPPSRRHATRTPRLSDSPFRLLQIVDKRLETQTADIQNKLRELFNESEARLLNQIEKRMCEKLNEMRLELNDVCERVNKLEIEMGANKTSTEGKLTDLKTDVTKMMEKTNDLKTVSGEDIVMKHELLNLKRKILQQENSAVSCELRIEGIPYYEGENLYNILCIMCSSLNIEIPNVSAIYRIRNRNNTTAPTILIKLMSSYEKNYVLKSVSNYRRKNKDLLRLYLLNFESNEPFYVNENLSRTNYQIFNKAMKLKKQNTLFSVFTVRGIVHVIKNEADQPVRIEFITELDELFRDNGNEMQMA